MKILIDGDACPVKNEVFEIAEKHHIDVQLITSYAHYSNKILPSHVRVQYVDNNKEMADYEIIRQIQKGDIIVTQDYGLASLCLSKAKVIHHTGKIYTTDNINELLEQRYYHQHLRKSGKKHQGPKPFTKETAETFKMNLEQIILE